MKKMLENIQSGPGSEGKAFVYSQFRTMEGIGIFSKVLEANGFVPFRIKVIPGAGKRKRQVYQEQLPGEEDKPKYSLWTGGESDDYREFIRTTFNSQENKNGEIIKVLLATSAGAEGITLEGVRQVHIMEPYWNMSRMDQKEAKIVIKKSEAKTAEIQKDFYQTSLLMNRFQKER